MEPGASCVLQPCDYHQERARYLGCEKTTHRISYFPNLQLSSMSLTEFMSNTSHADIVS
jgi:hypothetical protein